MLLTKKRYKPETCRSGDFGNTNLTEIKFNTPDDQVKNIVRRKIDASVGTAYEVLRTELIKWVLPAKRSESSWYRKNSVEMPGMKDIDRVKKMFDFCKTSVLGSTDGTGSFSLFPELSQLVKTKGDSMGVAKLQFHEPSSGWNYTWKCCCECKIADTAVVNKILTAQLL
jgi:SecD/SecF fusion protein